MGEQVDREAVARLMEGRRNPPSEEVAFGAERVDVELEGGGNGPFVCRKKAWSWTVDEPPERGGRDTAPNPLAYFLSGSATCLLSHYMLCAISEGVPVEGIELTARMRFHRALSGGRVTEVVYDLDLRSPAEPDTVLGLAGRAQDACYAHNTLGAGGVTLTTNLSLNGEPLSALVVSPAGSAS